MSWGLQFYEQNDLVNKAHFPDIYAQQKSSRSNKSGKSVHSGQDIALAKIDVLDQSVVKREGGDKEVVDWKYEPPAKLSNEK